VGFLRDVFLEDFGFGCLGVAEIHHFIEQFVDYDKVVTNGFFFELLEVLDHHLVSGHPTCGRYLDDFVEEKNDFDGVRVPLCQGKEV